MNPFRAITFDCAFTLMEAFWNPADVAIPVLEELGAEVPEHAAGLYSRAFSRLQGAYEESNRSGDPEIVRHFWLTVIADWLRSMHLTQIDPEAVHERVDQKLWGRSSSPFQPYDDALPTVKALHTEGVPMAVISNWDISLHRALDLHGFSPYFQFALASMEVGIEKPDAEIFHLAAKRLGLQPSEVLHVGDHPVSDVAGARQAGMQAILLDRDQPLPGSARIPSLNHLIPLVKDLYEPSDER